MAKKTIKAQMKQRRDTKANWAATNPVLLDGELGIVSDDPNLYKVGDGATAWNSLPFRGFDGTLAQELGTSPNAVISQKVVSEKLTELESHDVDITSKIGSLVLNKFELDYGSALHYSFTDGVFKANEAFRTFVINVDYLKDGFYFNDGFKPRDIYICNEHPLINPSTKYRSLTGDNFIGGIWTIKKRVEESFVVFELIETSLPQSFVINTVNNLQNKISKDVFGYDEIHTSWSVGYYINDSGEAVQLGSLNDNYAVANNLIEVSEGDEIVSNIIANDNSGIAFFDSNNELISITRITSENGIYTVPARANYARVGSSSVQSIKERLFIGKKTSDYSIYAYIKNLQKDNKNINSSINNFYINDYKKYVSINEIVDIQFYKGYIVMPDEKHPSIQAGTYIDIGSNRYAASEQYVKTQKNEIFTTSYGFGEITGVAFYDENKNYISSLNSSVDSYFVVPDDERIKYLRIGYLDENIEVSKCYLLRGNAKDVFFIEKNYNEIKSLNERLAQKPLYGKKVVVFGDSITQFTDNKGKSWTDYFSEITGATTYNFAVGGTKLARGQFPSSIETAEDASISIQISSLIHQVAINNYDMLRDAIKYRHDNGNEGIVTNALERIYSEIVNVDFSDIDIVIVFGGQNDYTEYKVIGDINSFDTQTISGALNTICKEIQEAYKHLNLIVLTPIAGYSGTPFTDEKWEGTQVVTGRTKEDVVECMLDVAKSNMIPCWDMYHEIGINKYNFLQYFNDNDGHHPYKGFEYIGKKIAKYITSIL